MPTNNESEVEVELDLDAPSKFPNLTLRQVNDWEARHRQFCKLVHLQPCDCSPWEKTDETQ